MLIVSTKNNVSKRLTIISDVIVSLIVTNSLETNLTVSVRHLSTYSIVGIGFSMIVVTGLPLVSPHPFHATMTPNRNAIKYGRYVFSRWVAIAFIF